ncbi:dapper homolog 3-like [Schistocerca piceifrons]|uniref:dapper homolog 3-like n=1 Tax=Schistocerca piceifrons TaxID=274613 RepID=UPI001F5EA7C0|nr:dapper homolog 3-like [Schistocerca piceifrons]
MAAPRGGGREGCNCARAPWGTDGNRGRARRPPAIKYSGGRRARAAGNGAHASSGERTRSQTLAGQGPPRHTQVEAPGATRPRYWGALRGNAGQQQRDAERRGTEVPKQPAFGSDGPGRAAAEAAAAVAAATGESDGVGTAQQSGGRRIAAARDSAGQRGRRDSAEQRGTARAQRERGAARDSAGTKRARSSAGRREPTEQTAHHTRSGDIEPIPPANKGGPQPGAQVRPFSADPGGRWYSAAPDRAGQLAGGPELSARRRARRAAPEYQRAAPAILGQPRRITCRVTKAFSSKKRSQQNLVPPTATLPAKLLRVWRVSLMR